jgi:hypothetical protein
MMAAASRQRDAALWPIACSPQGTAMWVEGRGGADVRKLGSMCICICAQSVHTGSATGSFVVLSKVCGNAARCACCLVVCSPPRALPPSSPRAHPLQAESATCKAPPLFLTRLAQDQFSMAGSSSTLKPQMAAPHCMTRGSSLWDDGVQVGKARAVVGGGCGIGNRAFVCQNVCRCVPKPPPNSHPHASPARRPMTAPPATCTPTCTPAVPTVRLHAGTRPGRARHAAARRSTPDTPRVQWARPECASARPVDRPARGSARPRLTLRECVSMSGPIWCV